MYKKLIYKNIMNITKFIIFFSLSIILYLFDYFFIVNDSNNIPYDLLQYVIVPKWTGEKHHCASKYSKKIIEP